MHKQKSENIQNGKNGKTVDNRKYEESPLLPQVLSGSSKIIESDEPFTLPNDEANLAKKQGPHANDWLKNELNKLTYQNDLLKSQLVVKDKELKLQRFIKTDYNSLNTSPQHMQHMSRNRQNQTVNKPKKTDSIQELNLKL